MRIEKYLKDTKQWIDKALDLYLPKISEPPTIMHKAMRYSVFSGGKRIRPIFAIAAAEACGGFIDDVLATACAIELIHTYSLIHDDLPCIDDADTRRNKPSSHKKFGEAIAVLAGDALLTLAFELIDARVIKDICLAIGTEGMIGGQALEIVTSHKSPVTRNLKKISEMKTGALIAASIKVGGVLAGADKKKIDALFGFGKNVGLAFQIVDDVLDKEGYASVAGKNTALRYAQELIDDGKNTISQCGLKRDMLCQIADYVVTRKQ